MTTTESITKTLGSGSGIDINALVASLVTAQYATKKAALSTRSDALTAQISGVAKLKSAITGFDTALKTLVAGGTLATQPTSSSPGVVSVSALPGAKLSGFSAQLGVRQLAQAEAATTDAAVDRTARFRPGTLAIRIGAQPIDANGDPTATVTIPDGGATLDDVAAQINATRAKTGLTATVVTDGQGVRLTIKGASGAAQAFTIDGGDDANAVDGDGYQDLSGLSVGTDASGTTIGTVAQDAVVTLDGATFSRAANTIDDLVPGVRLSLSGVSTSAVTLGSTPPTSALSQAVGDFVDTYNQMLSVVKDETDAKTGVLKSESNVTAMARQLSQLTTAVLQTSGTGPRTLADLGVSTARDGTLSVDSTKLAKALADYPDQVEAMFAAGKGATAGGLSGVLSAIATRVTDPTYGLDATTARYTKLQSDVGDAEAKLEDDETASTTRLTQQFSAMDSKVAAYKSTQAFLTQQIAAWNKSDN